MLIYRTICNLGIGVCFGVIAVTLLLYWHKKRVSMDYPINYIMFASFIGCCGVTRLLTGIGHYAWIEILTDISLGFTFLCSLGTATLFPILAREQSEMKTPNEYYKLLEEHHRALLLTKDACTRINGIIFGLQAKKSWVMQEATHKTKEVDIQILNEFDELIQEAEETKQRLEAKEQRHGKPSSNVTV